MIPPEYETIEDFIEYMLDDERYHYTHQDLALLSESLKMSTGQVRSLLDDWGLKLARRPRKKEVRGFNSWDNNRWAGNPGAGGSGWEQISGFAGQKG